MIKKILLFLSILLSLALFSTKVMALDIGPISIGNSCKFNGSVRGSAASCLRGTELYDGNADVENGLRKTVITWTNNIALYLGILAVFGIVFGSFSLAISTGNDEKINKAKDIIKWSIIGFLGVIMAATIIHIVIKVFYQL